METMDTETLVRQWRAATDELRVPADFAARVIRGGHRRSARRRTAAIAGSALLVLTVAAVGVTASGAPDVVVSDDRLSQPTRGDLAGDQHLLNVALRTWSLGITHSPNTERGIFDDPRSAAHVYWAGTTPAGPAVVVLQAFYLHPHANLSPSEWDETQTLVGLVGIDPATGELALLGDQYRSDGSAESGAFRFGPGDRTVLVLEREHSVYFATRHTFTAEGRAIRDWQPLIFTDGVAVFEVPAEDRPSAIRLVERSTPPEPTDLGRDTPGLWAKTASLYVRFSHAVRDGLRIAIALPENDYRLAWHDQICRAIGDVPTDVHVRAPAIFHNALLEWGTVDEVYGVVGSWCVLVRLDDETMVIVREYQNDEERSRIYAVTTNTGGEPQRIQVGGFIDRSSALPVAIRLTGRHGWVVAAYGFDLAYRTTVDGGWTAAGANAALLPDAATAVRVTGPRGVETVVPLTG
jgi:hypothetical protein